MTTRRGFIRGLVGLAALAAAPTLPLAIAKTQQELFLEEAVGGVIRGKVFYLDGPITLKGVKNLIIDECSFFCKYIGDKAMLTIEDCDGLWLTNCTFHGDSYDPSNPV